MFKNLYLKLVALFAIVLMAGNLNASHLAGMDLTYEYAGSPNTFKLTLKVYRDCSGITVSSSYNLCYFSNNLGQQGTVTATQVAGPNVVPTPPCINAGLSSCQGGSAYGIEEFVYEVTVTLPGQATDWVFYTSDGGLCCRNPAITTLQNPGGDGQNVYATLDNLNFPANSSAAFASLPVTQFCINNAFYFSQFATDIDGDSLRFSLTEPLNYSATCGTIAAPVQFANPYTYLAPFTTLNGVNVDPIQGYIAFTPTAIEVGVMALLVEDFDKTTGLLRGSIRRDIQINIISNCNIIIPNFSTSTINGVPKALQAQCRDTCIIVPLDKVVQCGSIAPNGSDFRAIRPNGAPNPIFKAEPHNCVNGFTDSVKVYFYKHLTQGTTQLWIKKGGDNNTLLSECGTEMPESDTINIVVVDPTIMALPVIDTASSCAFSSFVVNMPEDISCYSIAGDGSDFTFVDNIGTNYPIASASGVNCSFAIEYTNQIAITLSGVANGNQPYYLISKPGTDNNTISNSCDKFILNDTVAIIYTNAFVTANLGNDTTLCASQNSLVLDPGNVGATYTWYFNGAPIGGNTQQLTAAQTGTYMVNVFYGPSCQGYDTINVQYLPAPVVNLGNNLSICDGDVFPVLDAGNPGANYQWLLNGNPIATTQTITTTTAGTYTVIVSASTCTASSSVQVIVANSTPFDLGADQDICETGNVSISTSVPGSSYIWALNGTNLNNNNQTYTATQAGSYVVELTNTDGCKSRDTVVVNVEKLPGKPIVKCALGQSGYQFVYTWDAIAGASGYEVSINGAAFIANNLPPTSHGVNEAPSTFTVHALGVECANGPESDPAFCDIVIPNIVTPNGDNMNDLFFIQNLAQFGNAQLKLFNRWGNVIYENGSYKNDYNFADQPDGVYYYILTVEQLDKDYSGNVTVYRQK
ncbi:MAG: gliding motility-associated C-terminal domain-containing protein [Bacteroidetes bacterium]|nr:gliding motility-associated C-terminal domain-containing protein [Bacteroidota bacterium]